MVAMHLVLGSFRFTSNHSSWTLQSYASPFQDGGCAVHEGLNSDPEAMHIAHPLEIRSSIIFYCLYVVSSSERWCAWNSFGTVFQGPTHSAPTFGRWAASFMSMVPRAVRSAECQSTLRSLCNSPPCLLNSIDLQLVALLVNAVSPQCSSSRRCATDCPVWVVPNRSVPEVVRSQSAIRCTKHSWFGAEDRISLSYQVDFVFGQRSIQTRSFDHLMLLARKKWLWLWTFCRDQSASATSVEASGRDFPVATCCVTWCRCRCGLLSACDATTCLISAG